MQAEFVLSKWFPERSTCCSKKVQACIETIENFSTIGIGKNNELE
jgi:hypothetical protein